MSAFVNALAGLGFIALVWIVITVWVKVIWPILYRRILHKSPLKPWKVHRLGYALETMRSHGWDFNIYGFGGKKIGFGIVIGSKDEDYDYKEEKV